MFISMFYRFKFKNKKVCISCFHVKKQLQHLSGNTNIHFHAHEFFRSSEVPVI